MILAFGFALGVLLTVLAAEYERRKRRCPFVGTVEVARSALVGYGTWTRGYLCSDNLSRPFGDITLSAASFADAAPCRRRERAAQAVAAAFQDSTLPKVK